MKYKILHTVQSDCVKYKIGEVVEFSNAEAKILFACKAIEPAHSIIPVPASFQLNIPKA
jgi:hypothetical protein